MARVQSSSGEERSGQRNNARKDAEWYEKQLAFSEESRRTDGKRFFARFECESGKDGRFSKEIKMLNVLSHHRNNKGKDAEWIWFFVVLSER